MSTYAVPIRPCTLMPRHAGLIKLADASSGFSSNNAERRSIFFSFFLSHVCLTSGEIPTLCEMQGVRHSKPLEVTKEIKAQLKEQVQPLESSLAETIVAAGKQKLAKKPEDKQSALTGNP